MSSKDDGRRIHDLAREALAELGLVVEDVAVTPAGKRRLVRIAVDHDLSRLGLTDDASTVPHLTLDEVADATRAVSTALDDADEMGAAPYVLEVSSPGVDRPLTDPRHFRRNVGRLLQVHRSADEPVTGRLLSAGAEGVTLLTQGLKGRPVTGSSADRSTWSRRPTLRRKCRVSVSGRSTPGELTSRT